MKLFLKWSARYSSQIVLSESFQAAFFYATKAEHANLGQDNLLQFQTRFRLTLDHFMALARRVPLEVDGNFLRN